MRRVPLFVLVAVIAVIALVGVALAGTRSPDTNGSGPAAGAAGGADAAAPTPALAGDVPPSQPEAEASAAPVDTHTSRPENAAAATSKGSNDCRDDCGDPGGSDCSPSTHAAHTSTSVIDDDNDGDGGDCGEGD